MVSFVSFMIFSIGTIMGSFYGVVGTRLPKGESIIKPGSHCEKCKKTLAWYELIPLLSYIFQKGRCRKCHEKLSPSYFIVELTCGLLFLYAYIKYGISYEFFVSVILSSLVLIIFISDLKYMIILDSPLIISAIFLFCLKGVYFGISSALLSIGEGLISFFLMFAIGRLGDAIFKRESLGGGDIKLSFLFGMTLGPQMAVTALILSTFLALPYAFVSLMLKSNHEVPFGPFLVASLWIVFHFFEKFQLIVNLILGI